VQPYNLTQISNYEEKRDFPAVDATYLSPHLRFGTSVRKMVNWAANTNAVFLRIDMAGIFMQILFNFPREVTNNFTRVRWNSVVE
jgi:deoxyribodipyrimidine photo-lyase